MNVDYLGLAIAHWMFAVVVGSCIGLVVRDLIAAIRERK